MRHLIDKLKETRNLNKEEWQSLLEWGRNLAEEEISQGLGSDLDEVVESLRAEHGL